jgi:hypothetical protein
MPTRSATVDNAAGLSAIPDPQVNSGPCFCTEYTGTSILFTPAKAGVQGKLLQLSPLDSRFRAGAVRGAVVGCCVLISDNQKVGMQPSADIVKSRSGVGDEAPLAVLLFCSELSAIDLPFPAEILNRPRFGDRKNSVALAVSPLFSAVLGGEMKGRADRMIARNNFGKDIIRAGSLSI